MVKFQLLLTTVGLCCLTSSFAGYTGPTNQEGVDLIKYYEGWYPNFYTDPVGIRTIGYGHACHVWDCSVPLNGKYSVPLSITNGDLLLKEDLAWPGRYEDCIVDQITYANLNANQYSALVSFAFNLGCGSVSSSTLRTHLNAGRTLDASLEFAKWINAGGSPLLGLARRRESERQLFCKSGGCETSCAGVVTADSLNIRKDPSASAFVVGSHTNGARVDIYARVTGDSVSGNPYWFRVGPGYVSAYYINIVASGTAWCTN